jgi:hypothetical protein
MKLSRNLRTPPQENGEEKFSNFCARFRLRLEATNFQRKMVANSKMITFVSREYETILSLSD